MQQDTLNNTIDKGEDGIEGASYQCMNCGSTLEYKPGTTSLHCIHCGADTPIEAKMVEEVRELDFETHAQSYEQINRQATKVISCRNCGAESTFDENTKSTSCPYCSTPLIADDVHDERLIQASYILPFHVQKNQVRQQTQKWFSSLWFAPNKLKRDALNTDYLHALYMPCWTYDAQTETSYVGQRGDNYTVVVGNSNNRRTVVRTRWRRASGQVSLFFDDVLISASTRINQHLFEDIAKGGWDTRNMVEFDNRFLSGFATEKYTVNLKDGFNQAKYVMTRSIDEAIRRDIGGDQQQISSKRTDISKVTFKLILLPVYISSYTYSNKLYHFYVNGRNGYVTGDRPYSMVKLILAGIAGIIALFVLYCLTQE